jgi:hypothetical protein
VVTSSCSVADFQLCDGVSNGFYDADAFVADGHAVWDVKEV